MNAATKSRIKADGVEVQFLLDAVETDGQATAFVTKVEAGGNTLPAHSHEWDETMYVTAGALTFMIDDEVQVVPAGGAVFIPRGSVHKYENLSEHAASMLIVSTPGMNHESYFADVANVLNDPNGRDQDAAIKHLMDQHGVVAG